MIMFPTYSEQSFIFTVVTASEVTVIVQAPPIGDKVTGVADAQNTAIDDKSPPPSGGCNKCQGVCTRVWHCDHLDLYTFFRNLRLHTSLDIKNIIIILHEIKHLSAM